MVVSARAVAAPKFAINRHWIEHTLTPYLRNAFSHALPYDANIEPQVQSAIEFCMRKPNHPTDGDDLLFERICLAIEFRYKNLARDLSVVTENLEPLARFLIRRAQLKGPYELLGRMNIASGAWRKYEFERLDKLREASENNPFDQSLVAPPKAAKATSTEDRLDPRLVNAQSGQYVSPNLSGTLSVAEDQYYRRQNRALDEYRQNSDALRCRQHRANAVYQSIPSQQLTPQQFPMEAMAFYGPTYNLPFQNEPNIITSSRVASDSSLNNRVNSSFTTVPTADFEHPGSDQWAQAAQQRDPNFNSMPQRYETHKILHLHQIQQYPGDYSQTCPEHIRSPAEPLPPPAASVSGHAVVQNMFQPAPPEAQQPQTMGMQSVNGQEVRNFVNHPGFSNIMSVFPISRYNQ